MDHIQRMRSLLRFRRQEVPKADAAINRCREVIQGLDEFWSSATSELVLNWHQCDYLLQRVKAADSTLAEIQHSPFLRDNTIPVLQELHHFLHGADKMMRRSNVTGTNAEWLRAAFEQGDMKESFSYLLYDIQWCTSLLQYILHENSRRSSEIKFDPTLCDCQLDSSNELDLVTRMKHDEMVLIDRLKNITQELHGTELEAKIASKLLEKLEASSLDQLVFLNPEDLDLEGEEIGKGAFAVVRKSNFLDSECVVKTLNTFYMTSIEKELDAIRKLGNHTHVVRHFSYSKDDLEQEVYFVMELLEMDLERAIRRMKGRLTVVEAVSLMLQIAEGMKYMHGKGVAHRDLKPGNVLVNFEKFEGCSRICSVKIADFGSTKAAARTETNTMGTGTTRYMAPEVMKATGDPEKARLNLLEADVYSFAIMSIHILIGKYPYKYNPQEIKERSKAGERPVLRNELPNCPLRLATLLTKCWSQNPRERPPFPEICRELRYIKGLLLKGDEQKLQMQSVAPQPQNFLGRVKLEGPWGSPSRRRAGRQFCDIAASIRRIKLGYKEAEDGPGRSGPVGLFKVTYEIPGKTYERESYLTFGERGQEPHHKIAEIEFLPGIEYIKQITGFLGVWNHVEQQWYVSSLTIHTNLQIYGPFGEKRGEKFTSDTGSRVIGFHGEGNVYLHELGIVTIPLT